MKAIVIIGGGAAALAIGYYFYKKSQNPNATPASVANDLVSQASSLVSSQPAQNNVVPMPPLDQPTLGVKQIAQSTAPVNQIISQLPMQPPVTIMPVVQTNQYEGKTVKGSSDAIYLIQNGQKRYVQTLSTLQSLYASGVQFYGVIADNILNSIPSGANMPDVTPVQQAQVITPDVIYQPSIVVAKPIVNNNTSVRTPIRSFEGLTSLLR